MPVKPMIRGNLCLNAHAEGCAASVRNQVEFIKKTFGGKREGGPALALVIGGSTGYGLASRITAAFGYGAATVGVSLEKAPAGERTATPGFYNNAEFDKLSAKAGLVSVTLDGDAFSSETKAKVIEAVKDAAKKAGCKPEIDLVVYSLASPARTDPATGIMYRSVIKPIGKRFCGRTFDLVSGKLNEVIVEPASEAEIAATIKVMGGEDWELWIDALDKASLLAPGARTVAYTYLGPPASWDIYKNGTIGRAKEDLEKASCAINAKWKGTGKTAFVSVNKAVVTRASAVIPIIPLYISALFKVMKAKGLHENCIEQTARLFRSRLFAGGLVETDGENRIRLDDWEMRCDVQSETAALLSRVTEDNLDTETDIAGFKRDFLAVHGFGIEGVDYE